MNAKHRPLGWLGVALGLALGLASTPAAAQTCAGYVDADVVALDQPWSWNRFGAVEPQGMMYALRRDVVPLADVDGIPDPGVTYTLSAGQVQLRRDKRPRPLVLRVNVGDCLRIHFTNLLDPVRHDDEQPNTRAASIHVLGLSPLNVTSDGSNAGVNPSGIVDPGLSIDYTLYAPREGGYILQSLGAPVGGEGEGGGTSAGLFGAVIVEPQGSEWYRSQVTRADTALATTSTDANGFPRIDYDKLYPPGGPYQNLPVLKMYVQTGSTSRTLVHSDLTAIVTGPNAGYLPASYSAEYPTSPLYPQRTEPFREFTIIFHDEIGAVQAFPQFEDRELQHTLHSVRDAFAINYGTGGAGAEILANRLGVGPAFDCAECKYEEFFLSSWALGDPAMVVDKPANAPCTESDIQSMGEPTYNNVAPYPCTPTPGRKAKVAFYPDDPSNVYHSYLNDHVKFRNLHAGSDDHHIFHLHAHQWVHSPKEDLSSYHDSQAIGQGGSFTYEIAHEGSGNLNKTVGDSIFHCHFYPHFAQGMWSLWRVHDVLELGTPIDARGMPKGNSRALPDNEILAGTPIPGLLPIPVLPMAPIPGIAKINPLTGQADLSLATKNPGYPFFVAGLAGRRAPHPPLDTIHDGGLARHVAVAGTATSSETRLDFSKKLNKLQVSFLPETGTPIEVMAMNFHNHPGGYADPRPDGQPTADTFEVNTHPQVAGAPMADPCPTGSPMRYYKAAGIQLDLVINKAGWHFPQSRMLTLWNDVAPTLNGSRPPEPFFFRAKSGECIELWHTNLIPEVYQLDDFQVRTPTDLIGQHIHLVKFDVLASDGSGNGWNYEDGTFSPGEVRERIAAIRVANGCAPGDFSPLTCPKAQSHPFFGAHPADCQDPSSDTPKEDEWLGAQTTVQRWYADPITTLQNGERTLRTVFTHDHFGPSTHQQVGLYSGLIVEPKSSTWYHNETGTPLSTNGGLGLSQDGGPTSWQAVVKGTSAADNYREFMIEFNDFFLAYEPGGPKCPNKTWGYSDPQRAINAPGREELAPPQLFARPNTCPVNGPIGSIGPVAPCPEAVSADDPGTKVVNYRNEPAALRILDASSGTPQQAAGLAGDLSFVYETRTDRADPEFNVLPYAPYTTKAPYGPLTGGLYPGDPYTPLLRSYEGDQVKIRVLVGAHEESHNFSVHGMKWLREPEVKDSGWRASQMMGISEWTDLEVGRIPALNTDGKFADFLYKPGTAAESQWDGLWGLIRTYRGSRPDLKLLDAYNPDAHATDVAGGYRVTTDSTAVGSRPTTDATSTGATGEVIERGVQPSAAVAPPVPFPTKCPSSAPLRSYDITAVWAAEVLRNDPTGVSGLVYNRRPDAVVHPAPPEGHGGTSYGPLHQPDAILFVYTSDLSYSLGRPVLNPGVRREPLVLRANAGECIAVKLRNDINPAYADLQDGWDSMPMIVENFNTDQIKTSLDVGLHPQLVAYDVMTSDGANVGLNPTQLGKQTVSPTQVITYFWYAGGFNNTSGAASAIEFGASGLTSSDPIKHTNKGAIGALIVEPPSSTWTLDNVPETDGSIRQSRASATVTAPDVKFREFVLQFQDDINLRFKKAEGYDYDQRSGPAVQSLELNGDPENSGQKAINYRTEPLWYRGGWAPETPPTQTRDFTQFNLLMSNAWVGQDPETQVFTASVGSQTRMRILHPGGHENPVVFTLDGHVWQEHPVLSGSSSTRLGANNKCEWKGSRDGLGASDHYDALLQGGAGGLMGATGDFLYRDFSATHLDDGLWGLLRVQ